MDAVLREARALVQSGGIAGGLASVSQGHVRDWQASAHPAFTSQKRPPGGGLDAMG